MASSYFTIPSFNRAKKNKEELEKKNPQEPVLKDEDEKFFDKEMRSGSTSEAAKEEPVVKITDDGEAKPVSAEEKEQAVTSEDQTIIPENRPDSGYDGASYDDAQREQAAAAVKDRKDKKKTKGMDLPSQEEAEAATRGFNAQAAQSEGQEDKSQGEKKTWASYLSSMRNKRPQSSGGTEQTPPPSAGGEEKKDDGASKETDGEKTTDGDKPAEDQQPKPTWTQYASSYVPSIPNFTSKSKKSDADSKHEPVYNEDGTVNETATAEKQEREVSVLLDNLNLSSINNRVFSFSADTQKLYERFLLCLKDVVRGGPTAYEDMEKLMQEAGPKLEAQWKTMPPFVQTLVKSLPMKLGPEIAAMASENPNDAMKKNLASASKQSSSGGGSEGLASAGMSGSEEKTDGEQQKKKKRTIPGMKTLTGQQGAIATLLRNTVSFITTRFPFLASMTNVVMSLAVFILMFVFWYCHKRGKEVRLAQEAEGKAVEGGEAEEVEVSDSADDDEEVEAMVGELEKADAAEETGQDGKAASEILGQAEPAEVPLPEGKGESVEREEEVNEKNEDEVSEKKEEATTT